MTPARDLPPLPVPLTSDGLTRWLSEARRRAADLAILAAHGTDRERSLACQHLAAALEDTCDAVPIIGTALHDESERAIALARELRERSPGPSS